MNYRPFHVVRWFVSQLFIVSFILSPFAWLAIWYF